MEFAVNRRLVRLITPTGRFSSGWSAESGRSPGEFFWGFFIVSGRNTLAHPTRRERLGCRRRRSARPIGGTSSMAFSPSIEGWRNWSR